MLNIILLTLLNLSSGLNSKLELREGYIFQIIDDSLNYPRVSTIKITSTRSNDFSYIFLNPSHVYGIDSSFDSLYSKKKIGKYTIKPIFSKAIYANVSVAREYVRTMSNSEFLRHSRNNEIKKHYESSLNWWEATADTNNIKKIPSISPGDIVEVGVDFISKKDTIKVIGFNTYGVAAIEYNKSVSMKRQTHKSNIEDFDVEDSANRMMRLFDFSSLSKIRNRGTWSVISNEEIYNWECVLFRYWQKENFDKREKYYSSDIDDLEAWSKLIIVD